MGCPVSVTATNLVMKHTENHVLSSEGITVSFYKGYMDDTSVILKRDDISTFHTLLSNVHPNTKFRVEKESDFQLSFLGVLVTLDDLRNVSTLVYRKPCAKGSALHFIHSMPLNTNVLR